MKDAEYEVIGFIKLAKSFLKYYWHQICKYRIRLATPPILDQSIAIITTGALSSIVIIEITKYANNKVKKRVRDDAATWIQQAQVNPEVNALPLLQQQALIAKMTDIQATADLKVKAFEARYSDVAGIIKNLRSLQK